MKKSSIRSACYTLILACCCFQAFSQPAKVSGQITDSAGEPLVAAVVRVAGQHTVTNRHGSFQLNLDPGTHKFFIQHLGYPSQMKTLVIRSDTAIAFVLQNTENLSELVVVFNRAKEQTPMAYTNLPKEELERRNLGQDIPQLLRFTPSVVSTSDAGAGIGYTGMRIRGIDSRGIDVTINGVPYNDSESEGTWWVDIPDIASSTANIQIQRGLGSATHGAGAFGASINLLTEIPSDSAGVRLSNSLGSFQTRRHVLQVKTGKLADHFYFQARGSITRSDGYVDRATSDLKSYYSAVAYQSKKSTLQLLAFGGQEITGQAWYGIDAETLKADRRYNPAGSYRDADGKTRFYDNEVDHYNQDNYQLHFTQRFSHNWKLSATLHYTYGRGYYESYQTGQAFAKYGFKPLPICETPIHTTDIVQRKWLDNRFYGGIFSIDYGLERVAVVLGGGWSRYGGAHFGTVQWARYASQSRIRDRFYDNDGVKRDRNLYAKVDYRLSKGLNAYGAAQIRRLDYRIRGTDESDGGAVPIQIKDELFSFNPKVGMSYSWGAHHTLYASYARASREPNRTDYKEAPAERLPRSETLNDLEWGWRHKAQRFALEANGFYMRYHNQLVPTGKRDPVGSPIRSNIGKSYRLGVELSANWVFAPQWRWSPNLTLSRNRNLKSLVNSGGGGRVKNLGNTAIAYSPSVISGSTLDFQPIPNITLSWYSKVVGAQYLANGEPKSGRLNAYWVNDFGVRFSFKKWGFEKIESSLLINNFADVKYESNGAFYDKSYYFPQAGTNFLIGLDISL